MFAVFTVSMGYGVVLPLLPDRIEQLIGPGAEAVQVSRHVGLITGIYTLALFLYAPTWGRISDRRGRRGVLIVGLVGFGATMLALSSVHALWAVYLERFVSGMFAAAVTPVASAAIGDLAATEQARARRLTFISLSGVSGFLLGPMLGVFIDRSAVQFPGLAQAGGSLGIPLAATALLALAAALAVGLAVPRATLGGDAARKSATLARAMPAWVLPTLLALTFIASAGVGVFEVGLALRSRQELGLTPYQIALMFSECSLVMFVAQAIVFSPVMKPRATRWLVPPALAGLTAGLILVSRASEFSSMLIVVGTIAASAGILSPVLTYWISSLAGNAQGAELGKQTAAASLGAALGSVAGGLLLDVADLPGASFLLTAGLAAVGFILSLKLPRMLGALILR
ncbi:MAG: MFS transporter [Minicystis sp.]